ncbi:hypothetical protein DFO73_11570 [Cytobacillus oceanisediminis]|uniref:Uncharacterized protein n=1 Tax=Cytobacillus oceanisediminis TaxID=665099 RepID=A0A2V2ZLE6_9BACI|nr:hypothetical protein DFO73_11570 [Cytobacillus oceanisediminis]
MKSLKTRSLKSSSSSMSLASMRAASRFRSLRIMMRLSIKKPQKRLLFEESLFLIISLISMENPVVQISVEKSFSCTYYKAETKAANAGLSIPATIISSKSQITKKAKADV